MNFKKLAGLALASSILLSSGAATVFANSTDNAIDGTNVKGSDSTTTKVTIKDATGPDPLDPSDPNGGGENVPGNPSLPDQEYLTLVDVPATYLFESKVLKSGRYSLDAKGENIVASKDQTTASIRVFNDRSSRKWQVKASIDGKVLTTKDAKEVDVENLVMTTDDAHTIETGKEAVVAQNAKEPNAANNTGTIETPVTAVTINLHDAKSVIKAKDELTGKINYQLYIVPAN